MKRHLQQIEVERIENELKNKGGLPTAMQGLQAN
jgi:hypothetical protein